MGTSLLAEMHCLSKKNPPPLLENPKLQIVFLPDEIETRVEKERNCDAVGLEGNLVSGVLEDSLGISELQFLRQPRLSQHPTPVANRTCILLPAIYIGVLSYATAASSALVRPTRET